MTKDNNKMKKVTRTAMAKKRAKRSAKKARRKWRRSLYQKETMLKRRKPWSSGDSEGRLGETSTPPTEPCASKWGRAELRQPRAGRLRKAKMHARGSCGTTR